MVLQPLQWPLTVLVRGERSTDGLVDAQWRKGTLARIVERLGKLG